MSIFDQRGQQVNYQYNSAGNINFYEIKNTDDFSRELHKLHNEIQLLAKASILDEDVSRQMDTNLQVAEDEAKKETPSKKTIMENLLEAKALIEGLVTATGLVTGLMQAIEVANRLFLK